MLLILVTLTPEEVIARAFEVIIELVCAEDLDYFDSSSIVSLFFTPFQPSILYLLLAKMLSDAIL